MPWPEDELVAWQQLHEIAEQLTPNTTALLDAYLFRGQGVYGWKLQTSLQRVLSRDLTSQEALNTEAFLETRFREQAHFILERTTYPRPTTVLEWWALMQHYGCPTRLLDWSASIYVAAYFACLDYWEQDGALWIVHAPALIRAQEVILKDGLEIQDVFRQEDAPQIVLPFWSSQPTDRMVAQRSYFTACARVLDNQEAVISAVCGQNYNSGITFRKIKIPAKIKRNLLNLLRGMNVHAGSLFPGIEGLGKSLTEQARIHAHPRQT